MSPIALAPGSVPWLLAHELRLAFRARTKRGNATMLIVLFVLVVMMMVVGLPLALALRITHLRETPSLFMLLDLIVLAIFTLILSQTLAGAISAFFERGDLDLLLSSPLPPRKVLAVRAVAIAVTPFLWFTGLVSIVVVPTAAVGQVRWLAAYPVLIALAMLASAAGMSLAMALFGLIGARRARTVGQLLAALIGAGFFLFGQLRNMLPDRGQQLFAGVMRWADSGAFAPGSPLAWPARAVLGHPAPLAGLAGGSAMLFAAVVWSLGRRFASNASLAAGASVGRARSAGRRASARAFEGGLNAALMRKELRLLLRDPALLSQVLLRVLYVLPLSFALVRAGAHSGRQANAFIATGGPIALTMMVVFVAGQLAGSLAWITISAEDAPELLACAPVDGGQVRRAKLAAAMIPVLALIGPLLAVLAWLSPWTGLCAAVGAAGSAVSAGLLNLWFEKPASRRTFRGRRTGSVLATVAEALAGIGWGVSAGLASAGWLLALISLAITLGMMAVARAAAKPTRAY